MSKRTTNKNRRGPLERDKKPYTTPVLKSYGTLRELVRAKQGTKLDGASGFQTKLGM